MNRIGLLEDHERIAQLIRQAMAGVGIEVTFPLRASARRMPFFSSVAPVAWSIATKALA